MLEKVWPWFRNRAREAHLPRGTVAHVPERRGRSQEIRMLALSPLAVNVLTSATTGEINMGGRAHRFGAAARIRLYPYSSVIFSSSVGANPYELVLEELPGREMQPRAMNAFLEGAGAVENGKMHLNGIFRQSVAGSVAELLDRFIQQEYPEHCDRAGGSISNAAYAVVAGKGDFFHQRLGWFLREQLLPTQPKIYDVPDLATDHDFVVGLVRARRVEVTPALAAILLEQFKKEAAQPVPGRVAFKSGPPSLVRLRIKGIVDTKGDRIMLPSRVPTHAIRHDGYPAMLNVEELAQSRLLASRIVLEDGNQIEVQLADELIEVGLPYTPSQVRSLLVTTAPEPAVYVRGSVFIG